MKLKRIIKYVLNKAGVPGNEFAGTHVENIYLDPHSPNAGNVSFGAATAGSGTVSYTYDNTVDFKITVDGDNASTAIVYMSGPRQYLINADANGEVHTHVIDGHYNYYVYGTTSGLTSSNGSFTASTTGTISVAL